MKQLYKGTFNWYGETLVLYTHAHSIDQALMNFCRKMTKTLGYSRYYIYNYFMQVSRDGYLITKEKHHGSDNIRRTY